MAEEQSDFEKVQEFIKEQVQEFAQQQFTQFKTELTREPVKVDDAISEAQKQLRQTLSPFIDPGINDAKITAQSAVDYVDFYTTNPEAIEFKDAVEDAFTKMKEAGRPVSRRDIYAHMLGGEFIKDRAGFMEKQSVKTKEQLARASDAGDVGLMSYNKAKNDTTWSDFNKLSVEDMEKMLEGIGF